MVVLWGGVHEGTVSSSISCPPVSADLIHVTLGRISDPHRNLDVGCLTSLLGLVRKVLGGPLPKGRRITTHEAAGSFPRVAVEFLTIEAGCTVSGKHGIEWNTLRRETEVTFVCTLVFICPRLASVPHSHQFIGVMCRWIFCSPLKDCHRTDWPLKSRSDRSHGGPRCPMRPKVTTHSK